MAKKPKMAAEDRLNWDDFGVLENLLAFCAVGSRNVPAESGVQFGVRSNPDEEICVLYCTDRGNNDPLIKEADTENVLSNRKSDYLALYIKGKEIIVTLIEMKGKDEKKLRKGLRQIRNVYEKLKKEVKDKLPKQFKIHIQGILLAPTNANLPLNEMDELAEKEQLIVAPLRFHQQFELYSYISRKLERKDLKTVYQHERGLENRNFNEVENILTKHIHKKTIRDEHFNKLRIELPMKEHCYLNFHAPNSDGYFIFHATRKKARVFKA